MLDGMGVGVMGGGLLIIVLRAFTPVQGWILYAHLCKIVGELLTCVDIVYLWNLNVFQCPYYHTEA